MSDKTEALRAELELAEAEEAFIVTKADKDKDPGAYTEAKHSLREMRQAFRENHRITPTGPGDAAPTPDAVDTKVKAS